MGIRVVCPNGHEFKVKDKYAGKKGLCPHCEGQVIVQVPDALSSFETNEEFQRETLKQRQAAHQPKESAKSSSSSSSVLDDSHEALGSSPSTSGSLLGSSVLRHNIKCACGQRVPMWYARCPACGQYLEH
jgi:hypothetical protein